MIHLQVNQQIVLIILLIHSQLQLETNKFFKYRTLNLEYLELLRLMQFKIYLR